MIAVVLATYNGEKYLAAQLNSIISQSVKPDCIYIYDDGSSDSTLNVIKKFVKESSIQIVLKQNSVNKGYTKNFLDALYEMNDDYIFLSDQDDVWDENKISEFLKCLDKQNQNIPCLVTSGYRICNQDLVEFKKKHISKLFISSEINKKSFFKDCSYPGMTFCLNKALIKQLKSQEDTYDNIFFHDFYISMTALKTGKLIRINKPLVLYRQHQNNQLGAGGKGMSSIQHWSIVLENKRREVLSALEFFPHDRYLNAKMSFVNKRVNWFNDKKTFSILISFIKYIVFFNFKSFIADLYYSIKR